MMLRNVVRPTVLLTLAVLLGASTAALAQGGRRGAHMMGGRMYDPATEVTIEGTIDDVRQIPGPAGGPGGLHLTILGGGTALEVHLGPASFVRSKKFELAKGDAVTVTGSKVTMAGREVIVAREVKKGEMVLTLRDAQGFPLWAGGGRRTF